MKLNQLWVRISLTYVAIMIFLIVIPTGIYLTIQADNINLVNPDVGSSVTVTNDPQSVIPDQDKPLWAK